MKKFALFSSLTFASASLLLLCGAASSPAPIQKAAGSGPTLGSKLATTIDLNDSTDEEIRSYYSSLNALETSERRGNNLLKNLKPILQDFTYYKYDDVWKIYEITDREWELSPATTDEENGIAYDETTNSFTSYKYGTSNSKGGSNPYVHTLYRNRDASGVTVEDAQIREWGDHNATGTNREHVWCQSRGFKADSGAEGPAGTDVHHLISGDGKVNQSYHNNSPYGYVDKSKTYKNASKDQPWLDGNLLGPQLHTHAEDQETSVFEPQDSDKGDIARACFYMAACYNNWSGNEVITQFNPNLILVDYATDAGAAEDSSSSHPVAMGILSDLLEWHRLDPVDDYEIHRNNLIYKNFQHNRNPFIDFPEWVDLIWGEKKDSTSAAANPVSDKIAISSQAKHISLSSKEIIMFAGDSKTIDATVTTEATVTWSVEDPTIASITPDGNRCEVKALPGNGGSTMLKASITVDGVEESVYCKIKVSPKQPGGDKPIEGDPSGAEELPLMTKVIIGVVAVIVLIILIIIFSKMSKRNKKKVIKKLTKSSSKKSSSKSRKK